MEEGRNWRGLTWLLHLIHAQDYCGSQDPTVCGGLLKGQHWNEIGQAFAVVVLSGLGESRLFLAQLECREG